MTWTVTVNVTLEVEGDNDLEARLNAEDMLRSKGFIHIYTDEIRRKPEKSEAQTCKAEGCVNPPASDSRGISVDYCSYHYDEYLKNRDREKRLYGK